MGVVKVIKQEDRNARAAPYRGEADSARKCRPRLADSIWEFFYWREGEKTEARSLAAV